MNGNYIITAIVPQNSKHNLYHDEMRGSIAVVKQADFTSVWDGGVAVTTNCKVNMVTKEVFDIKVSEGTADMVNNLEEEYVTIDGEQFPVSDEEAEDGYWYN